MDSRWTVLHRWEWRLTTRGCREGRGAPRRGAFKLVGSRCEPPAVTEKRVRARPATGGQVPETGVAAKGRPWEPPNARTGDRHRWIGRADQGGRANPG